MKSSSHDTTGYRFGPYESDLRAGELRKHGVKIKLQEQPFQVLTALLERAAEVVTREELHQRLWPADTFVDFDHGLNAALARLREALCDSAAAPRYIETIPRRGYRFLGKVETLGGESVSERRMMLAVLPFENLDAVPEQEYFADGMTEEMIAQLGRLNPAQLGVIARTSAMQYKRTTKGVDQIGKELSVDFVLEGSVRRAGERVRITSQLIRVRDQSHLWAESYDRTMDDVLAIQTECAGRIAHSLALELLPSQREAMTRASTRDPAAYEAYLQGRYYWNKRSEEGFRKAIGFFERAIELDPSYALAYVGLSDVYDVLGMFSVLPPKEAYEKAQAATKKALVIDERLAEAHSSLAYARFLYEWDWAGAEREFGMGLDLNPNYVVGHYWYALFLAAMGRFDEAFSHIEEARQLDPLSLVVKNHHGWILYFARQYEQAVEQFQAALELDPGFYLARVFLGLTYVQLGKLPQATEALVQSRDASGIHPGPISALAAVYSLAGKGVEASRAVAQVKQMAEQRYVSPYYLALASLGLGEKEAALEWLEKAYQERSGWLVNLKVEPSMDALRSHPRFRKLVRRLALPE
ncbi:MAG: winged helix-turn-helix domain-containing protein [Acidobacteria bacterium]|nr:winged helix-turn-helix domain-containing protein [Acidobacteriota bacterium]